MTKPPALLRRDLSETADGVTFVNTSGSCYPFLGDFRQFRPVQERTILIRSNDMPWDERKTFAAEQRHQHDKAHALWNQFTTVVMLKEQVRAAGDPQLQRLLTRIRQGVQDQSDVELLNSACYRKDMRIPWESGITVVTPLNRNRWNLNMEAALAYQRQHQVALELKQYITSKMVVSHRYQDVHWFAAASLHF